MVNCWVEFIDLLPTNNRTQSNPHRWAETLIMVGVKISKACEVVWDIHPPKWNFNYCTNPGHAMKGFWLVGTLLLPQLDPHQCPAPDHSHIATSLPSSKRFANRTGATITCCTATPNARPIGVFAHQTTHTRFGRRTCRGGREACGVLHKQRMIRDLFNAKSRICEWFLYVFFGARESTALAPLSCNFMTLQPASLSNLTQVLGHQFIWHLGTIHTLGIAFSTRHRQGMHYRHIPQLTEVSCRNPLHSLTFSTANTLALIQVVSWPFLHLKK